MTRAPRAPLASSPRVAGSLFVGGWGTVLGPAGDRPGAAAEVARPFPGPNSRSCIHQRPPLMIRKKRLRRGEPKYRIKDRSERGTSGLAKNSPSIPFIDRTREFLKFESYFGLILNLGRDARVGAGRLGRLRAEPSRSDRPNGVEVCPKPRLEAGGAGSTRLRPLS